MRSVAAALNQLARAEPVAIKVVLHTNPAIAEAMRKALAPSPRVELLQPLVHAEMIAAMRAADVLLSDSGGVQEEAPALGIPLLALREKTERPEGVATGNTLLVGTGRERIVAEVMRLFDPVARAAMSRSSLPFGDGHAGPRIADAMLAWIGRQEPGLRRAG
jgi:UDP-N-acetylglucosamine 2-epimerase (non-hydrolysing)